MQLASLAKNLRKLRRHGQKITCLSFTNEAKLLKHIDINNI